MTAKLPNSSIAAALLGRPTSALPSVPLPPPVPTRQMAQAVPFQVVEKATGFYIVGPNGPVHVVPKGGRDAASVAQSFADQFNARVQTR